VDSPDLKEKETDPPDENPHLKGGKQTADEENDPHTVSDS
jgi:hypothetical protein